MADSAAPANSTRHEVEIKSLLASKTEQDEVVAKMKSIAPSMPPPKSVIHHNHYYTGNKYRDLLDSLPELPIADNTAFLDVVKHSTSVSLRTRNIDNSSSWLVLKGAKAGGSADHAVDRLEFEAKLPMTQDHLDDRITAAGFEVLSKWYAERDQYTFRGVTVEIIFTSGYGYLTEVEAIAYGDTSAVQAEADVRDVMAVLGLDELSGDRLGRMFKHYNQHWQEYYGTRKTFTLE